MIILNALLQSLQSRGIITSEERGNIVDLHVLSSVLEGKVGEILTESELVYLQQMNVWLADRDFYLIRKAVPPPSMKEFHEMLVRSLPSIQSSCIFESV